MIILIMLKCVEDIPKNIPNAWYNKIEYSKIANWVIRVSDKMIK